MPQTSFRLGSIPLAGVCVAFVAAWAFAEPPSPAVPGYRDFAAFAKQAQELDRSDLVAVTPLATTSQGRPVLLLTIAAPAPGPAAPGPAAAPAKPGDNPVMAPATKPAILIVGNVHAPHLAGGEMAMRLAEMLVAKAGDEKVKPLLERFTFYIIPRPSPDATELFFVKPHAERLGNARSTDDDRDGRSDEDGPDDLNGDGVITMMRVADPAGEWITHPDDPRIMIKADPFKKERGQFKLYTEGRDDDKDESFNEDGPGGVDFNRNFTFQYPFFKPGAGPHQVSEPETRAIADFCFDHPEIAAVLTFSPDDNLFHPWKPGAGGQDGRIKTNIQGGDAPLHEHVAKLYRDAHGGKDCPGPGSNEGSFAHWAYFHYGRWSFSARGWWVPKVDAKPAEVKPTPVSGNAEGVSAEKKESKDAKEGDAKSQAPKPADAPKKSDDARGSDDANALRWLAEKKIDGFVNWQAIEHPDFAGKKVEIGGFKPYVLINPPATELDALTDKHLKWLGDVAELLPRIEISETKVAPLGAGVYRVTVAVSNTSFLPTMSEMGRTTRQPHPVQLKIDLPAGAKFAQQASARTSLNPIKGGGREEHTWLILAPKGGAAKVRAWSPSVGAHETNIELKEAK